MQIYVLRLLLLRFLKYKTFHNRKKKKEPFALESLNWHSYERGKTSWLGQKAGGRRASDVLLWKCRETTRRSITVLSLTCNDPDSIPVSHMTRFLLHPRIVSHPAPENHLI